MTKVGSQVPLPGAVPGVTPGIIPGRAQAIAPVSPGVVPVEQTSAGILAKPIERGDLRVKVYDDEGQIIELMPQDYAELTKLKGEAQFKRAQELGIINREAQYIPGKEGTWSYVPGEAWQEFPQSLKEAAAKGTEAFQKEMTRLQEESALEQEKFARENVKLADDSWIPREAFEQLPEAVQETGKTQGYEAMLQMVEQHNIEAEQKAAAKQKQVERFYQENVRLGHGKDAKWVSKDWFYDLPKELQQIGKEQGYDALTSAIRDFEAWQNAFKAIEPYKIKTPDGSPAYNFQAAIADMASGKLDRNTLELTFGPQEVADAEKIYLALTPFARAGGVPFKPDDPDNLENMLQWWLQAKNRPVSQEEFLRLTIDPVAEVVAEDIKKDIQAGKYQEFLPQFAGNRSAALDWWLKAAKGEIPLSSKEMEQVQQLMQAKLDEVIPQMTPFVLTGSMQDEIDITGMMKAGIDPRLVYAYAGGQEGTGMTLDEFRTQAKWEQASTSEKANIMVDRFLRQSPVLAAEMIVPGLYVARHWDELAPWEKAVSIGIDALSLVPIVGGAAAGARSVATASRTARMIQAGKGALAGAGTLITSPINMIIHPLETAKWTKTTARSLLENLLDPKKIPEAVISTTTGVPMIRVGTDMSVDKALKAQEELLKAVQQGDRPLIYVKNPKTGTWDMVELVRGPLMDVTGGVAHASPDISKIAKGTKVLPKGVIPKEEGIFIALQPAIEFALKTPPLPVPRRASPAMKTLAQNYRELELVAQADLPSIRQVRFADAAQITDEFEQKVLRPYLEGLRMRHPDFRIGGSFNEWLKVPGAKQPNDIDIITPNAHEELDKLIDMAQAAGFNARRAPGLNSLIISKGGKTWRPIDMPPMDLHIKQIPAGLTQPTKYIDGFPFENIGEQYIRQSYGAISGTKKAPQRTSQLKKMAPKILNELERQGIHVAEPGIAIYSPETARKAVASQKTFFSHKGMELSLEKPKLTVETEGKFLVDEVLPQLQHSLYTRVGPEGTKLTIYLEKPLTKRQLAKLKALGLVETLKAPFKPPLKIAHGATPLAVGGELGPDEVDELAKFLRETGNEDVARRLTDLNELYIRPNVAAMYRALNTTVGRAVRSAPPILQPETGRLIRPDSLNRNATARAVARATVALPATRVERRQARVRASTEAVRPPRETEVTRLPRRIEATRPPRETETIRPPRREIIEPPPRFPPGRRPPQPPPPTPPETSDKYAKKTTRQKQRYDGAVAWQQGALKRDDKLVPVWKIWSAPYDQGSLETLFEDELPPGIKTVGGIKEAEETVQLYRGTISPSESHQADIGAFTVTVKSVSPEPGVDAEMEFRPDRPSDKALRKMPLGTTVNQLIREVYPEKVPKSTADRMLREKLSKMSAKEIAAELNKALGQEKTKSKRLDEALSMLPDRVRNEVKMWMGTTSEEAPVRGYPKPEMIPEKFRRKKRTLKTGAKKVKTKSKSKLDSEKGISLIRGVV